MVIRIDKDYLLCSVTDAYDLSFPLYDFEKPVSIDYEFDIIHAIV